jgi:hypothetical protein
MHSPSRRPLSSIGAEDGSATVKNICRLGDW